MIQQMTQTVSLSGVRRQRLAFVADGNVYVSTYGGSGVGLRAPVLASGGQNVVGSSDPVQMAQVSGPGRVYITAPGLAIKQLNTATSAMVAYAATAGSAPSGGTLCCIWRDRLIVSGVPNDPQNFFASRSGTHTDWDYAERDPAAAFAGNFTAGGLLSDIIVGLIPFGSDQLVFGCERSLYRMVGDVAAGGSVQLITDKIGLLGANAWAMDNAGAVYLASNAGLFRYDGALSNLSSGRLNSFFAAIDRTRATVQVRYDPIRLGVWVFVTPNNSAEGTATHLWYDQRTDSFWPQRFAAGEIGPTASLVYDGDDPADTAVLLGGRDGYVRQVHDGATSDDGSAIASHVFLAPQRPAGDTVETNFIAVDATMGELPAGEAFNAAVQLRVAPDLYSILSSPTETRSFAFTTPGKQVSQGARIGGHAAVVRVSNDVLDKSWACERITARAFMGGRTR